MSYVLIKKLVKLMACKMILQCGIFHLFVLTLILIQTVKFESDHSEACIFILLVIMKLTLCLRFLAVKLA